MSDGDALLEAVLADPADDAPRLVYADWLEEHGDPERAEFIRLQCELAGWEPDDSPEPLLIDPHGNRKSPDDPGLARRTARERNLFRAHWARWVDSVVRVEPDGDRPASRFGWLARRVRDRERPTASRFSPDLGIGCELASTHRADPVRRLHFRRGFVDSVSLNDGAPHAQLVRLIEVTPAQSFWVGARTLAARRADPMPGLGRHLTQFQVQCPNEEAVRAAFAWAGPADLRTLTLSLEAFTDGLGRLLGSADVSSSLEYLGLIVSVWSRPLTPVQARLLAASAFVRRVPQVALVCQADGDAYSILCEALGPPTTDGRIYLFHKLPPPTNPALT